MALADDLFSIMVRHQVNLERVNAGMERIIRTALRELATELAAIIARYDPSAVSRLGAQEQRLLRLLGASEEAIQEALSSIQQSVSLELSRLAQLEQNITLDGLNGVIGATLADKRMSGEMLRAIAGKALVQGDTMGQWWKDLRTGTKRKITRELRQGLVAGEGLSDLVRRIRGRRENGFQDGVTGWATRQATAVVRTAVAAVTGEARLATLKNNQHIVKAVHWVSTLDNRTTPQCMALDGMTWALPDMTPQNGALPFPGHPPIHWQCRSTLAPVLPKFDDVPARLRNRIPEDKRASMTGEVPESMTYDAWLRRQSREVQVEALGATRRRMWAQGRIQSVRQLVDQRARPLSVAELIQRYGAPDD